uniref:Exocyst subunit Exo70 family protein n=1 Tax=Wollemia nobilis TaxID=56998 RepID=A0A0C9S996_9CONI
MDHLGDEKNKQGVLSRGNSVENSECPTENLANLEENSEYPPQNSATGEEDLEGAEKLILKWDMASSESARQSMIFEGREEEAEDYLRMVDEVQKLMDSVSLSQDSVHKAQNLLQMAMVRLEEEFRNILEVHSEPLDPELVFNPASMRSSISRTSSEGFMYRESNSSDDDETEEEEEEVAASHPLTEGICEMDLIPQDVIPDLHRIAERMVSAGYVRECMQVYGSIRKSIVDDSLLRLGIEKLSIGDVQRLDWNILEGKIKKWIKAAKVCIRMLFASEKRLCEQIFEGISPVGETCFAELAKSATLQLFNFSEAIAISRRSPEKLFKILDLYECLSELLPDIEVIFSDEMCSHVKTQASEILTRLGEAARGIFTEFENAIQKETSKAAIPGGTVHPITRYVMNYINLVSDYKETLIKLIVNKPSQTSKFLPEGLMDSVEEYAAACDSCNRSLLSLHLIWVTVILQHNLEGKSKLYKDVSLSHLFMMNNVHYMVRKVKASDLRDLIGDGWLRKHSGKVKQCAITYQRATWIKVLSCLRDEGIHVSGSFSSGVSKTALKERFKSFNATFEEVHRCQATWIVPDAQLREELRISIEEKLLPAYRSFLGRFKNYLESERHSEMYIKYSPENLENAILDFFEGSPVSVHVRRGSH